MAKILSDQLCEAEKRVVRHEGGEMYNPGLREAPQRPLWRAKGEEEEGERGGDGEEEEKRSENNRGER